jgi:hypothetical protein
MIPKHLGQSPRSVSVRSQSALTKCAERRLRNPMQNNLRGCDPSTVRFQSALVHRVAENCCKHFPRGGHAIPADRMSVDL